MKAFRTITIGAALSAALVAGSVKPAHASPCETLMCMSGLVGNGSPGGGCGSPITAYFTIIRFNFWGYDAVATREARQRYLTSCPGSAANMAWVEAIQAVWGEVI